MQSLQKLKSINQLLKKKKKYDKIVLLAKTILNTVEVLISKVVIGSYIYHDKFVSISNVLREYNKLKEEIKNLENIVEYIIQK